jgi:hypothetical protein
MRFPFLLPGDRSVPRGPGIGSVRGPAVVQVDAVDEGRAKVGHKPIGAAQTHAHKHTRFLCPWALLME